MATVRFSESLKHEINQAANSLFDARIALARGAIMPDDIGERVVMPYINKIIDAFKDVPTEFLHYSTSVEVRLSTVRCGRVSATLQLPHDCPRPRSTYSPREGVMVQESYRGLVVSLAMVAIPEDMAEGVKAREQVLVDVTEERRVFSENLNKLITHYTTLAPALKEWPPLWDLLPESAKDRHKQITEKRKRTKATEELDLSLDRMTGTVVASKLAKK